MIERSARVSDCGTYRYVLERRWASGHPLAWVMLNPSTADAEFDDPTVRRVMSFSKAAGAPAARIYNLFALRATDPSELARHSDPVGPENRRLLTELIDDYSLGFLEGVVCAWGANPLAAVALADGPLDGLLALSLGTTKGGHPRHPLYVAGDTRLRAFRVRSDQRPTAGVMDVLADWMQSVEARDYALGLGLGPGFVVALDHLGAALKADEA